MLLSVIDNVLIRSSKDESVSADIWCIPSAINSGRSYIPLLEALRDAHFTVRSLDFYGYGASPSDPKTASIDGLVGIAHDCIAHMSGERPVVLVGHSLGSAVAVRLASRLGDRARGVFSIEGNLTQADGYLSALAVDHAVAQSFKAMIAKRLVRLLPKGVEAELALADFAQCDALTLWNIGRSSYEQGRGDRFGHELISLRIPVLYYWGRTNTPPETVEFIAAHGVRNIEFDESGHWPMKEIPARLAEEVMAFASACFR